MIQNSSFRVHPPSFSGVRPLVFLNVAISADGKLAPASRQFRPFGGPRDQALLYELRAQADAILCGVRTVESAKVILGTGGDRYRRLRLSRGLSEYPLRIILSGSGSVSPQAEIFRHRFSPILVVTTERASRRRLEGLGKVADEILVCGKSEADFAAVLHRLHKHWGVRRLLCEGGGEVNGALFRAGLVDELHVTVCPMVLGGRDAPTLADGAGIARLVEAVPLVLEWSRRADDELFLCYRRATTVKP